MNHQASIAQMESSRFVGGRAQTQALLLAPSMSRDHAHFEQCYFPREVLSGLCQRQYARRREYDRIPYGNERPVLHDAVVNPDAAAAA